MCEGASQGYDANLNLKDIYKKNKKIPHPPKYLMIAPNFRARKGGKERNADYGGMVQPKQQEVEWGMGTRC